MMLFFADNVDATCWDAAHLLLICLVNTGHSADTTDAAEGNCTGS